MCLIAKSLATTDIFCDLLMPFLDKLSSKHILSVDTVQEHWPDYKSWQESWEIYMNEKKTSSVLSKSVRIEIVQL